MRSARLKVVFVLVVLSAIVPTGSQSASADPGHSLPLTTYFAMLVDGAHQHVFVTGGFGSSGILVVDFNGNLLQTIPNEPSPAGMVLSQDGSALYVALQGQSGIDQIDPGSLTKVG